MSRHLIAGSLILTAALAPTASKAIVTFTASCSPINLSSCNKTVGDVQFSNFSLTGITAAPADVIDLTVKWTAGLFPPINRHRVSLSGRVDYTFGSFRTASITDALFSYTVSLNTSIPVQFGTAQSYQPDTGGDASVTLKLSAPAMQADSIASDSADGALVAFTTSETVQTFSQTINFTPNTNGKLFTFSSGFEAVPAPLPILSGVAAFLSLRRLKSISQEISDLS